MLKREMRSRRDDESTDERVWKACLACGNRFVAKNHGYRVNWCSPACEQTTLRQQRDAIETAWLRARWFLR